MPEVPLIKVISVQSLIRKDWGGKLNVDLGAGIIPIQSDTEEKF